MLLLISVLLAVLTATNCYAAISVGDSVGGGTVFCVSDTRDNIRNCSTKKHARGKYGLIMTNEDLQHNPLQPWSQWSKERAVTGAVSLDDGAINTRAIIQAMPGPENNTSNNAAWLCYTYRDSEGQDGWYLPSIYEGHKMRSYAFENNLIEKKGKKAKTSNVYCFKDRTTYWSSTELDSRKYSVEQASQYAYILNINYDFLDYRGLTMEKTGLYTKVRAIRTFDPAIIKIFNAARKKDNLGIKTKLNLKQCEQYRQLVSIVMPTTQDLISTIDLLDNTLISEQLAEKIVTTDPISINTDNEPQDQANESDMVNSETTDQINAMILGDRQSSQQNELISEITTDDATAPSESLVAS